METKMITIPFDLERAKRIQAGEEPGKIVTRAGSNVRIICWDKKDDAFPIVALIEDGNIELISTYKTDGMFRYGDKELSDLMLQVPEWAQFKDGDVIYCDTTDGRGDKYIWIAVIKELRGQVSDDINIDFYFSIDVEGKDKGKSVFDGIDHFANYVRIATDEEKLQLIEALKQSSASRAKEYLKRFFGIEEKPKHKFKPFDKVLMRDNDKKWCIDFFSHFNFDEKYLPFICVGGMTDECIPYNDQTKHLLGTTDNWEG